MRSITSLTETHRKTNTPGTGNDHNSYEQYALVLDGFEILCFNGDKVRVAFAMDCLIVKS